MTTKPMINFSVDTADLQRIEEFHHRHRFPNRAAAIKWLLSWALEQNPVPQRLVARLAVRLPDEWKSRGNLQSSECLPNPLTQAGPPAAPLRPAGIPQPQEPDKGLPSWFGLYCAAGRTNQSKQIAADGKPVLVEPKDGR
jgi:hypothetical protein